MKNAILISILSAGILLVGSAQANYIDPATEHNLVKICEALKSNSKIRLLKAVKLSGLSFKKVAKGLVCNGHDPVTFALVNNSHKTAKLVARRSNMDYDALLAKL
ncbi:MAG: hypothetical protein ACI8Z9_000697 [Paraglaciecola sp.]|jgi:hypothetical protein